MGKATRIKKSAKIHVERQDTSRANVGRKAVEQRIKRTANQANNVGETEETGGRELDHDGLEIEY